MISPRMRSFVIGAACCLSPALAVASLNTVPLTAMESSSPSAARPLMPILRAYATAETEAGSAARGHSLGLQLGEQAKSLLERWHRSDTQIHSLRDWLASDVTNRERFELLRNGSSDAFPQYAAEIEGMAEASGIDIESLWLANLRFELVDLMMEAPKQNHHKVDEFESFDSLPTKQCTDVFVRSEAIGNRPPFVGFGHNEDWMVDWTELVYIVELYSGGPQPVLDSVAYTYPGMLPGVLSFLNRHGLAYSTNSLYPKLLSRSLAEGETAVGLAVLGRHYMESGRSLDELSALIQDESRETTSMAHSLGRMRDSKARCQPEMRNIESYLVVEGSRPHWKYSELTLTAAVPNYFHGNQFRHVPHVSQYPSRSTDRRKAAYDAAVAEKRYSGGKLIRRVLGDSSFDPAFPVYRTGRKTDTAFTLMTGVFDLWGGSFEIYGGNPSPASNPPAHPVHVYRFREGRIWREERWEGAADNNTIQQRRNPLESRNASRRKRPPSLAMGEVLEKLLAVAA